MLILEKLKKTPHIVLADDNPEECLVFMNALENLKIHHIFSLAENGAMLLSMLDEYTFLPDIIFIDLDMKGISGKVCLEAIRMSKKLDEVPVIVYSKSVESEDIKYCYNAKANLYVVKSDFVSTLNSMLKIVLQKPLNSLLSVQKEQFLQNICLS